MKRRALLGSLGLLLLLAESAPAEEKWGPFRGRVLDIETGQGIAEAVILAIWLEKWSSPIETHTRFYDAKEVLSRPDGTFEIPRLAPPFFRFRIMEPMFKVFAPGYAEHRWVITPPTGEPLIAPTVIEMRKLKTREERLRNLDFAYGPSVPDDKQTLYRQAIRRGRKELGLGP